MIKVNSVKKIGVLSDTHIPSRSPVLPPKLLRLFHGVDMIIHCGDITDDESLAPLAEIAPLYAVRGNMDGPESSFPAEHVIEINSKFILCVAHGRGSSVGLKEKLFTQFKEYKPYMILFGHTHFGEFTALNGVFFFNPGSATSGYDHNSAGMLTVGNDEITAELLRL